jgi:ADP-ribosyl-[dinitrogen reductase] hydrolase
MTLVLSGLLHGVHRDGVHRDDVLATDWQPVVQLAKLTPLHPAIAEVAGGSFRRKEPPEIKGSGWVVQSLEATLWAFHRADSFEEAVLCAVNLGDDADTMGAVCGQFAGACWGESGIPQRWRDGLARRDLIEAALRGIIV